MYITRYLHLDNKLTKGRVLFIYGPRRTGKTSLLKTFLQTFNGKYFFGTGDDLQLQSILTNRTKQNYTTHFSEFDLIAIDEAQYIPNIGENLKYLVDLFPNKFFIATGSSALFLNQQVGEPLTGRKWEYTLYPISYLELANHYSNYKLTEQIDTHLIYGLYPEVVTTNSLTQKRKILGEITNSYLLKDILTFESLKSPILLHNLLKLLAYQIGSEVSLNELANNLHIDHKTVHRYIDLLTKTFIIYPLQGFSRNLRKEITKKNKYYFIDLGIRNALINNFEPIENRPDKGQLWENFLIIERLKLHTYLETFRQMYFWRTWDKQEIDLIETKDSQIYAYEFKYSENAAKKARMSQKFLETYNPTKFSVIHKGNFLDFVLKV